MDSFPLGFDTTELGSILAVGGLSNLVIGCIIHCMGNHSNPNGANQFLSDPRQKLLWENYNNPKSETFSNGYQSAIKAGYEESSAKIITTEKWFIDKLRRINLVSKAEKMLDKTLDYASEDIRGNPKVDLIKVQVDVAKHVTIKLGREEGYEDTKTIFVLPAELLKKNGLDTESP